MEPVSDTRINELLFIAAYKLGVDVSTCPVTSIKKLYLHLKMMKAQRTIDYTEGEIQAVRAELEAFL